MFALEAILAVLEEKIRTKKLFPSKEQLAVYYVNWPQLCILLD